MSFPDIDGVEVLRLPPRGVVPDLDNPARHPSALTQQIVFGVLAPLSFIALCQRYYTKVRLLKGLLIDDYLMLLGWIFAILTQTIMLSSISEGGLCRHSWEVPLKDYERYALKSYIAAPFYQLCNGIVKLSLLSFYLQLSPQRWFRLSVWISIGIVVCYTLVITAFFYFNCDPPRSQFDLHVTGECIDAGILMMATAVSNILTDVILFVLPIPMVYQLHMPRMQKLGAVIIFAIGSVTIGTSCLRLVALPPVLKSTDVSWDGCSANIWTICEANLFIICGSMPTLRKFFKHFAPRLMGSKSGDSSSYAQGYGASARSQPGLSAHRSAARRRAKQKHPYEHFDDDDFEMRNFRGVAGQTGMNKPEVVAGDVSPADRDDHSEKAILQTTTFTVQYDRDSLANERPSPEVPSG